MKLPDAPCIGVKGQMTTQTIMVNVLLMELALHLESVLNEASRPLTWLLYPLPHEHY